MKANEIRKKIIDGEIPGIEDPASAWFLESVIERILGYKEVKEAAKIGQVEFKKAFQSKMEEACNFVLKNNEDFINQSFYNSDLMDFIKLKIGRQVYKEINSE